MKKLLLLFAAIAVITSCKKEKQNDPFEGGNVTFSLKIEQGGYTKGLQDPAVIATDLNLGVMFVELFDASKIRIATVSVPKAQIATIVGGSALNAPERIIINKVDTRATFVKISAFVNDAITAAPDVTGSINTYQSAFNDVPFLPVAGTVGASITDADGFITIDKTTTEANGNFVWTAETTIAPYFARFEIKPTPGDGVVPNTTEEGNKFPVGTTISVTGIYMDGIKDAAATAIYTNGNIGGVTWGTGGWSLDNRFKGTGTPSWSNMFTESGEPNTTTAPIVLTDKADTYTLFAQGAAPKVVVRVWVDQPDGSPNGDYYGFVTISKFVSGATPLSAITAGKVYRMALDMILKPGDININPHDKPADLYAKVTVTNWAEENIKPSI